MAPAAGPRAVSVAVAEAVSDGSRGARGRVGYPGGRVGACGHLGGGARTPEGGRGRRVRRRGQRTGAAWGASPVADLLRPWANYLSASLHERVAATQARAYMSPNYCEIVRNLRVFRKSSFLRGMVLQIPQNAFLAIDGKPLAAAVFLIGPDLARHAGFGKRGDRPCLTMHTAAGALACRPCPARSLRVSSVGNEVDEGVARSRKRAAGAWFPV